MAATTIVDMAQVGDAIAKLTELNERLKAAVTALDTKRGELAGKWEGKSHDEFEIIFETDKTRWEGFARTIDTYIETLRKILDNWNRIEEDGAVTIKTRTF